MSTIANFTVEGPVGSGVAGGNPILTGGLDGSGNTVSHQCDALGNLKVYVASQGAGEDIANNVQGTISKPVIGATYSRSLDSSFGTAVTHNSKATAGQLLGFSVSNVNAAVRWFQVFNSTGSTSGTPLISVPVPAGTSTAPAVVTFGGELFGPNGLYCATGITWGVSTTQATYTGATAGDHNVNLAYL